MTLHKNPSRSGIIQYINTWAVGQWITNTSCITMEGYLKPPAAFTHCSMRLFLPHAVKESILGC